MKLINFIMNTRPLIYLARCSPEMQQLRKELDDALALVEYYHQKLLESREKEQEKTKHT